MNQGKDKPIFMLIKKHIGNWSFVVEIREGNIPYDTYENFSEQHFYECECCGDDDFYEVGEVGDILDVFDLAQKLRLTLEDIHIFPDSQQVLERLFTERDSLITESERDFHFYELETQLFTLGRIKFV